MQAKRIQTLRDTALGAGFEVTVVLEIPTVIREEVNMHNIWGSFMVEPEDTDANAFGNWVLYIIKEGGQVVPWTDVTVNAENNNFFVVGCGMWAASNQSPFTSPPIHPLTSRTLNAGDKLALGVTVLGLTAGQVTAQAMLCAHTTRK